MPSIGIIVKGDTREERRGRMELKGKEGLNLANTSK